jgi:hypothetical protein
MALKPLNQTRVSCAPAGAFKEGGRHVDLYYYPSDLLLSLLGNNPDEQAAKDLFFEAYSNNPLLAMAQYCKQYIPALTSSNGLKGVKPIAPTRQPLPKSA